MEWTQGNWFLGFEMLLIPVGFILGSMAAGYFTEVRPLRGKEWRASVPLVLVSVFLTLITVMGNKNAFGEFGEPLVLGRDFVLLTLLCFSCGLQNATLASLTGGAVRTTHMTGVATDLGLNATRILFRKDRVDLRWFRLRTLKMLFFGLGAAIGTGLFIRLDYTGFLVPSGLNLGLYFAMRYQISYRSNQNECHDRHQYSGTGAASDCLSHGPAWPRTRRSP